MNDMSIGIFDSGVGGLNILSACQSLLPNENYIYIFDRSCSPYGNKSNGFIYARAGYLTESLTDMGCKAVIIACNTATNVAIDRLRRYYSVPLIGVEPPVIPAVSNARGGKILVFLTEAAARQNKFRSLIKKADYNNLVILPQRNWASLIEENFGNLENLRGHVYSVLAEYPHPESIVLGCTHYYYIKNIIRDYYGDDVKIYDASGAVANRLKSVLEQNNIVNLTGKEGKIKQFYF